MSFYSAFSLCRPTKPPKVTGVDLADFLDAFGALGVVASDGFVYLNVRFGRSIDRDDKGTTIYTPVAPGMARVTSIKWDLEPEKLTSLQEITTELRRHDRPIYRAEAGLGGMTDELCAFVNSTSGLEGEPNLSLHSWHLSLEPQRPGLLDTSDDFYVGWMAIGMDGPGHLFPLNPPELVRRATTHPKLVAVAELCRRTWPVTTRPVKEPLWWQLPHKRKRHAQDMQGGRPSRRVQKARAAMGKAWPYPLDAPLDWHWSVHETG